MRALAILAALAALALAACGPAPEPSGDAPRRIVSLDYCADQYVLRFARREEILALSLHARDPYSFMREAAEGLPLVRPRSADVLALRPTHVVRSYGGGPNVAGFMERAGIEVVQIGFPSTIAEVREEVLRTGSRLGGTEAARGVAEEMDRRLEALAKESGKRREALYMTPGGVTPGDGTLVHELLVAAGLANFQKRGGWNPIPLERLAYERPDLIAAAFFENNASHVDSWSAARHPVTRSQIEELPVVPIDGAWTSCGGWFLVNAIEALALAEPGEASEGE
ncbi:MAG: ABC transporter substrate-binding protein [Erythrobacter sp.]|jgi:iron complex transport system substrate-binding protein|nr:ABC transporter substrate-binding protein [Erythrobacter sp.]